MILKKLIHKGIVIGLMGIVITSPIANTVSAMERETIESRVEYTVYDEATITNDLGYDSTIKTIINADNTRSYIINECGIEYKIYYDFENETVTIDDFQTYTLDNFFTAVNNQSDSFKMRKPSSLLEELKVFETIDSNTIISHTNVQPSDPNISEINNKSYPTTGYGKEYSAGTNKKLSMTIALSGAAVGAVAEFIFTGQVSLSKAYLTTVLKAAVKGGIIATITDSFRGDQYFDKYQSFHNTTSAVKERRAPYTKVQNATFYGDSFTWYFWSSRPEY